MAGPREATNIACKFYLLEIVVTRRGKSPGETVTVTQLLLTPGFFVGRMQFYTLEQLK